MLSAAEVIGALRVNLNALLIGVFIKIQSIFSLLSEFKFQPKFKKKKYRLFILNTGTPFTPYHVCPKAKQNLF